MRCLPDRFPLLGSVNTAELGSYPMSPTGMPAFFSAESPGEVLLSDETGWALKYDSHELG